MEESIQLEGIRFHTVINNFLNFVTVGAQGRPPPNIPQCHIDCFKLKSLEKQQEQEELSDSVLSL